MTDGTTEMAEEVDVSPVDPVDIKEAPDEATPQQQAEDSDPEAVPEPEAEPQPQKVDGALKAAVEKLQRTQADYDEANEETKALKKRMERAQDHLNEVAEAIVHPPVMPLYDRHDGPPEDAAETGSWRECPVSDLDLSQTVLDALAANEPRLITLGTLSDWMFKKADSWATDIKGVGEKARNDIEVGFQRFWAEHPEFCIEEPDEPEPEDDDEPEEYDGPEEET